MFIFVASNLNLGQDTRAFWVFVAYPIESCAVWEGEPAQYTGMPLRRALMERYSGVALAVSEHRGRGVRAISDGARGMVAAIAVAMVVAWGLRDRPSNRATATAAMAAMVVRERYRMLPMLDGNGGDGDGDGGDDDGSNGVDGDGG